MPVDLHPGKIRNAGDLRAVLDQLRSRLDAMSEMSDMMTIRLQMAMDRRTKFLLTLSNIMRKISATQDSIVQNLK